jgi:hypothetical protein
VRLPVVEAEVAVLRHQALAALKVGLHVGVNLQPVCVINVAADLSSADTMQQAGEASGAALSTLEGPTLMVLVGGLAHASYKP